MGLETVDESCVMRSRQVAPLSIALPKGRLLRPSLVCLRGIGLTCPDVDELDRRLVYEAADRRQVHHRTARRFAGLRGARRRRPA